ncbi:MAG: ATP synthase F1 subunit epsilon [Planctomycetes bacterium]|nr:ATP synthase F1 subunit epsilon [Planctomycetota bacterium]
MDIETTGKSLKCIIVTPERAVLDQTVDFVAVPMVDGELGVLPSRAPLIGRLGYGELRTQDGKNIQRFYIDGGFVQIRSDVVTVLTPKAIPAEQIKLAAAEEALKAAQGIAGTPEAQEAQSKSQQRARAQIRIASKTPAE